MEEYLGNQNDAIEGFSHPKTWKLKKKLFPRQCDPPMGKKDEQGRLVTAPNLIKDLYLRTYKKRLNNREMKEELLDLYFLKEELCSSRMEELRSKKTSPWSIPIIETSLLVWKGEFMWTTFHT